MGLFSRESAEAKTLKEEWKTASQNAENATPGTAAQTIASGHRAQAAKAYQAQVAKDKKR